MARDETLPRLVSAPHLLTEAEAQAWAREQLAPFSKTSTSRLSGDATRASHEAAQRAEQEFKTKSDQSERIRSDSTTAVAELVTRIASLQEKQLQLEDDLIDHKNALLQPDAQGHPSLLVQLEGLQQRVQHLSQAQEYFSKLEKAEELCIEAQDKLEAGSTDDALHVYVQLTGYRDTADLPKHAVDYITEMQLSVFDNLKSILDKRLSDALAAIGWPSKMDDLPPSPSNWRNMRQAFLDLFALQPVEASQAAKAPFPIETLAAPLNLRFRFHFDGNRPTNRLDKPEWCFAHILNCISEHQDFLSLEVQPLLDSQTTQWKGSVLPLFAKQLCLPMRRKIAASMSVLLESAPLLAHTIFQALEFDHALQDMYQVGDGQEAEEESVANVILGNTEWFEAWKEMERTGAENKYYDIISAPDAWQFADETSSENPTTKPTVSALRLRDLLESVSERYRPLPSFSHRLSFLLGIQVPLLDAYLQRITSAVDAIETLSVGIMRAVPGALGEGSGARLTSGLGGVERLIKASLSARWTAHICRTWSDDIFFLEMWQDVKDLPPHQLDPDMREPLRKLQTAQAGLAPQALFDVFAASFDAVAARASELLVRHVQREVVGELKPYLARRWDVEGAEGSAGAEGPDPVANELLPVLTLYRAFLSAMAADLSPLALQTVYRTIAQSIGDYLYGRLASKVYSLEGGQQLLADINQGWLKAARDAGVRRPEAGLQRLSDAAKVLALPTSADGSQAEGLGSSHGVTLAQGMAAAWDDEQPSSKCEALQRALGIQLNQHEIKVLLKRRRDCWR